MHLRDLMPARLAEAMARVQTARARAARLGREIHNRIHALNRHELAMTSRMAWLTAGVPSTLHPTTPRPRMTREAIRRWGFRGHRRILLLEGELALEIGNALRVLLELFPKPVILFAQLFDLLPRAVTRGARGLIAARALLPPSCHRRERTKS